MPTFTAIALDRLLEQGASKSHAKKRIDGPDSSSSLRLERSNTTPLPVDDVKVAAATRRLDIPPPRPQLRRRNSVAETAAPVSERRTPARPQISPALYATPESTPLPDSPTSSFPPSSPYIINHKRRGPRILKSFSDQNVVAAAEKMSKDGGGDEAVSKPRSNGHARSFSEESVARERKEERFDEETVSPRFPRDREGESGGPSNGDCVVVAQGAEIDVSNSNGGGGDNVVGEVGVDGLNNGELVGESCGEMKAVIGSSSERDGGETEDFFDPQESLSFMGSTDGDSYSARAGTPMGEFYDAWEELSSDSGRQTQRSLSDVETELREMRLSLLMEIEKRKQAEEAQNSIRSQWQILREKLGTVGLILPEDLCGISSEGSPSEDPAEEICRQIQLARFVSESIGRGIAKAEAEAEMEAQLEVKNFEIARLCDRLHYYETMNREMSQRNQEAIEIARHERQKRRRRQKWVWGSIAAAITLGSAALAWSYIPNGKGSSSIDSHESHEPDSNIQ